MANWYGTARSNYFHVKDKKKFKEHCDLMNLGVWDDRKDGRVGVYPWDNDDGGWPSSIPIDEEQQKKFGIEPTDGDYWEFDFAEEISKHLKKGEVAIFVQVGAEKMRYVTGHASAINSEGVLQTISLENIYEIAKGMTDRPDDVTIAEY